MNIENFSQNGEQQVILDYFGDEKISLLSIGENSGTHLSNVRASILKGSYGTLVEPAPKAFAELQNLYKENSEICLINAAISDYNGESDFFDSGTHLNKGDVSLLSSLNKNETLKWRANTSFEPIKVKVITFEHLLQVSRYKQFSFISLDSEGNDLTILRQMDLKDLGCQSLCIEYNSDPYLFNIMKFICEQQGLTEMLLKNGENIIMAAPK